MKNKKEDLHKNIASYCLLLTCIIPTLYSYFFQPQFAVPQALQSILFGVGEPSQVLAADMLGYRSILFVCVFCALIGLVVTSSAFYLFVRSFLQRHPAGLEKEDQTTLLIMQKPALFTGYCLWG